MARWHYRRRRILRYPDRRLKRVAEPILNFGGNDTKELEKTISILFTTLNKQTWGQMLGIAAPQIGISKRIIIVMGRVCINPSFTAPKMMPTIDIVEGCYSLGKDKLYKVPRSKYGWAKWQDTRGNYHEEKLTGIKAIVFQHECDHLEGKLCVSEGTPLEMPKVEQNKSLPTK